MAKQPLFFPRSRFAFALSVAAFSGASSFAQNPGLSFFEWHCFAPAWTNVLTRITTADVAIVIGPTATAHFADPTCSPITFLSHWPNSNRLQIELGPPGPCFPETAYGSALVLGFAPLTEGDWEVFSDSLKFSYTFHVYPADDRPTLAAKIADNQITLSWPTLIDRRYTVERTTNFITWSSIHGLNGTGATESVTFPTDATPAFYALRIYPRQNDLPDYRRSCPPPRQ